MIKNIGITLNQSKKKKRVDYDVQILKNVVE